MSSAAKATVQQAIKPKLVTLSVPHGTNCPITSDKTTPTPHVRLPVSCGANQLLATCKELVQSASWHLSTHTRPCTLIPAFSCARGTCTRTKMPESCGWGVQGSTHFCAVLGQHAIESISCLAGLWCRYWPRDLNWNVQFHPQRIRSQRTRGFASNWTHCRGRSPPPLHEQWPESVSWVILGILTRPGLNHGRGGWGG